MHESSTAFLAYTRFAMLALGSVSGCTVDVGLTNNQTAGNSDGQTAPVDPSGDPTDGDVSGGGLSTDSGNTGGESTTTGESVDPEETLDPGASADSGALDTGTAAEPASTGETDSEGESTSAMSDAETTGGALPPEAPVLHLDFSQVKMFDFAWPATAGAEYYQLFERVDPSADFLPLGGKVVVEGQSHSMPLHLRFEASYFLQACNAAGCTDSEVVDVVDSLAIAVGYFKASNTGTGDAFGEAIALSADGNTLAVGAADEASAAGGIDGDQGDDSAPGAGAVYVFTRTGVTWSQQAYIKASNPDAGDAFGNSVALSADGDTLAIGAVLEDSAAKGVDADQIDDSAADAGAVYVFARSGGIWSQQAYVKASNTDPDDFFGGDVRLSADGNTLAVAAHYENGGTTGIGGNQADNSSGNSGAVYMFERVGEVWSQKAYIKASNTGVGDLFGINMALSADGHTLAVGAPYEDSAATGIAGGQFEDTASDAGAVYVFVRAGDAWVQQAYVKASNTGAGDYFGRGVALSADGGTLAVGAYMEDGGSVGINGDENNDLASKSGAIYVFTRVDGAWSQQAYVKASNTNSGDYLGFNTVTLSADGDTLAASAVLEDSAAAGIGGAQASNTADGAGAVYVFVRVGKSWSQKAFVKASNTGIGDGFGINVALSADGQTLAVGASKEASAAVGIGGDASDDSAPGAGAVYVY